MYHDNDVQIYSNVTVIYFTVIQYSALEFHFKFLITLLFF